MSKYFVYIIYSAKNDLYYIGHTKNLIDRLTRHNQNRSTFTKNKGPWKLVIKNNIFSCSTTGFTKSASLSIIADFCHEFPPSLLI
ncbi:MAG: GIY-YIG nuclease family protein [Bacteroidetes bacterium]|nr:GIY-YIG nuclease family protein [Bacteroidota bacterium]